MANANKQTSDEGLVITSLQNERVKAIRKLDNRKDRKEQDRFVAEGTSVLVMAKEQNVVPEVLVRHADQSEMTPHAKSVANWAKQNHAETLWVSERVLAKLTQKDNPQSLIGVFRQRWGAPANPKTLKPTDLWIALEEIRDPGNLGTIIRTAHAAGVSGVILVGNCCDPYSRECVRATMGSIFAVPLVRLTSGDFLNHCRSWTGDVVATHLKGDDFRATTYDGPVLLVMGREGPGLSDEAVQQASKVVRIPMSDHIDSLNVAVATALVTYEIKRAAL